MDSYGLINQARADQIAAIGNAVDGPLRQKFRDSFGHDRMVDAMVERMVQNALDAMPDDPAPDALPVRRIGLQGLTP